ncbi:MAG: hypothetical protein C5B57_02435 [Blastocatellia bacterium]|nr:MAG: hypothetical protein C5B57_02435 [Blastocatellia bacterium]
MKLSILVLSLTFNLSLASSTQGQTNPTEAGVKTTHEALVAAIKTGNLTMAQGLIDPQALGFFRESVRLVQLNGTYGPAQVLPDVLADLGRFVINPYETVYRVRGSTAIVAMSTQLAGKESEKTKTQSLRSTYVYIFINGNWKLLSWHTSVPPLPVK